MSKIAVIYWSGTGNTEAMAEAIAQAASAELFEVSSFNKNISDYDKIAFGCPSMGDEELEESDFAPFYNEIESELKGKKVALFGSYGWGDGEWIRSWADRVVKNGSELFGEGLAINDAPDDEGIADCTSFGEEFAKY